MPIDLAAQSARALLEFSSTLQSEGAGNAGRRCAAAKSVHVVTTVTPESPGIPRAMVLRFPSCSPRRSGSFATVTCGTYRKLDTSVEMSGPHDFTVRSKPRRQRAATSTASRPDVRDVRETPLCVGRDAVDID
jgi:hypothetical protein